MAANFHFPQSLYKYFCASFFAEHFGGGRSAEKFLSPRAAFPLRGEKHILLRALEKLGMRLKSEKQGAGVATIRQLPRRFP